MRVTFLALVLIVLGCSVSRSHDTHRAYSKSPTPEGHRFSYSGHEYIKFTYGGHAFSVVHNPDCIKCSKKEGN